MFLTLVLLVSLVALYKYLVNKSSYWNHKNIPNVPAPPLIGNLKDVVLLRKSVAEQIVDIYNHKNVRHSDIAGIHIFHKSALVIRDPGLIKQILVKDFGNFANRHSNSDEHSDILGSSNLFICRNPLWRQMRVRLTHVFTSGRMKSMFHLVNQVGIELNSFMEKIPLNPITKMASLELREVCALYTTDVIASCAFGVQANSLKDPNADFRKYGREIFNFTFLRAFEFSSIFFLPEIVPLFRFKVFSNLATKFIKSSISAVMEEREASNEKRNDLIDTLVALKNEDKNKSVKSGEVGKTF